MTHTKGKKNQIIVKEGDKAFVRKNLPRDGVSSHSEKTVKYKRNIALHVAFRVKINQFINM